MNTYRAVIVGLTGIGASRPLGDQSLARCRHRTHRHTTNTLKQKSSAYATCARRRWMTSPSDGAMSGPT